jgi:quercetin dioxygenase-like cupin family protein
MKPTKPIVLLLILILSTTLSFANPVEVHPILKTTKSWNGTTLPGFSSGQTEFTVLTFKVAPGAKTAIHLHPMNGVGYLLSGELTMYATDDPHGNFTTGKVKKIQLKSGDSWTETVNTWHYGENNTNKDVSFIVIFVGAEKTPPTLSLQ